MSANAYLINPGDHIVLVLLFQLLLLACAASHTSTWTQQFGLLLLENLDRVVYLQRIIDSSDPRVSLLVLWFENVLPLVRVRVLVVMECR